MKFIWVVKFISKRDWNEYHCHNPVYSLLDSVRGGYKVGFLIAGREPPVDCRNANNFELKKIFEERSRSNVYPIPFILETNLNL